MTDEDYIEDEYDEEPRGGRARITLVAILILLFLMLLGLGYVITRVVTPAGRPQGSQDSPVGLEWVRSMYGYGSKSTEMLRRPLDTAVAPDGTIYATDPQRARILSFAPDGSYKGLIQTGAPDTGQGRMLRPDRVSVDDDGNVYVADNGNQKVMVFSPRGEFVREWFVPRPTDIVVDDGRVYITTAYGVAVCKEDGTLIAIWGRRGPGPEEFDNPHGIVIGDDGTVYITDTLNARLKAYTKDGKVKWIWPADRATVNRSGVRPESKGSPLQIPTGICIDGKGRLVLVDPFAYEIIVLQPEAKGVRIVGRYGDKGDADAYFDYPDGIDYDPARDWFAVADAYNDRVQVVRIPGSTSNAALAAVRRAATGPLWWCLVPVLLLVAAVAVAIARRRTLRSAEEPDADAGSLITEDE